MRFQAVRQAGCIAVTVTHQERQERPMPYGQRSRIGKGPPASELEAGSFPELCRLLGVGPGANWPDRFGASLYAWAKSTIKGPIRTLSLFSGTGGLDIAFHDAGFQIETAVEIDERFAATLRANAE